MAQTRKESNPSVVDISTRKEMSSCSGRPTESMQPWWNCREGSSGYARGHPEQEHKEIRKQLDRAMELETQSEASVKYWEEVVKNGFKKGEYFTTFSRIREGSKKADCEFRNKGQEAKVTEKSGKGGEEE